MNEQIRVCNEHQNFSKDCAVCKLEAARNEMVKTFWYVTKCCEQPYLGRPMMDGPFPPEINTEEKAMKMMMDHILEVASTMVDRYA
jgi:hypothetical protein